MLPLSSRQVMNFTRQYDRNPVSFATFASPSYTVTIHHDSSRFQTDGKIGLHRDASGLKKKIMPASIRCLTMLLRCLHDSSTDPLRLKTAALQITTVELRMSYQYFTRVTNTYQLFTLQKCST